MLTLSGEKPHSTMYTMITGRVAQWSERSARFPKVLVSNPPFSPPHEMCFRSTLLAVWMNWRPFTGRAFPTSWSSRFFSNHCKFVIPSTLLIKPRAPPLREYSWPNCSYVQILRLQPPWSRHQWIGQCWKVSNRFLACSNFFQKLETRQRQQLFRYIRCH